MGKDEGQLPEGCFRQRKGKDEEELSEGCFGQRKGKGKLSEDCFGHARTRKGMSFEGHFGLEKGMVELAEGQLGWEELIMN